MVKNLPANGGDTGNAGLIPGSSKSSGGRNDNPLQYSCLEKSHGQRSLEGYSLWGHKESDTTELVSTHAEKTEDAIRLFKTSQFCGKSKLCLHLI